MTLVGPGGWILIENVPGLLSSHDGRDFAVLLATLAELGFHDLAWRVLDSRYFGVPQRRRRVFILGRRASGRRAEQVLLEPEGGGGDFEAGGEAREGVAGGVEDGVAGALAKRDFKGVGNQYVNEGKLIAGALSRRYGKGVNTTADDGAVVVGAPPDPNGVRAPSGVPRRLDGAVTAFDQQNSTMLGAETGTLQGEAERRANRGFLCVVTHPARSVVARALSRKMGIGVRVLAVRDAGCAPTTLSQTAPAMQPAEMP